MPGPRRYFYLLDALPLWISMTLYCFFWPSRFIDGVRESYSGELEANVGLAQSRRSPFHDRTSQGSHGTYEMESPGYKPYAPAKY